MMMTTKPIGLYVHVPFCVRKCNYCDFCSFPEERIAPESRALYIDTIASEILGYKREPRITVDTVFFGGGTPSLLTPSELEKIFHVIRSAFEILPNAEITLEANPGTITREKLIAYRSLGINRLSIGLQSIHENEQKILGRIHNYADFEKMFCLARECGFDNVSVDLMYGIPEQTADSFAKTLDTVIALSPEHISAYGLIIEEGTPFFERVNTLALPDEDAECDMYRLAIDKLSAAGYSHYDFCGRRYFNPDTLSEYTADSRFYSDDSGDGEFEYAMLAFRLAEGLSLSDFEARFSHSFTGGREELISRYVTLGYMRRDGDRIALTDDGMYVSNAILSELL